MTSCYADIECADFKAKNYNNNKKEEGDEEPNECDKCGSTSYKYSTVPCEKLGDGYYCNDCVLITQKKRRVVKRKKVLPLDLEECPVCFDKCEIFDNDYSEEMMCEKCIDKFEDELHEIYCSAEITVMGRKGTYYCLYGGGPEGGFFVSGDECYDIERGWGTEFKITRHYAKCDWSIRHKARSWIKYLYIPN